MEDYRKITTKTKVIILFSVLFLLLSILSLITYIINKEDNSTDNFEGSIIQEEQDLYVIKILSLAYYPLDSNDMLDKAILENPPNMNFTQIQSNVEELRDELEYLLEEGSRFRAYSNPTVNKSLDYQILQHKEYKEALPRDNNKQHPYEPSKKMNDYREIVTREDICDWVDNKGVSQVWLWGHPTLLNGGFESNMSSKYGDISNSDRDTKDLPICNKPYVLYEFNYGREVDCALESQMHQLESFFGYLDNNLFLYNFVGGDIPSASVKRCGNVHFPPNGKKDYDYSNKAGVTTDCMDWKPDAELLAKKPLSKRTSYLEPYTLTWKQETLGKLSVFNCEKWGCSHKGWFVFWMQSMPGYNNGLTYMGQKMPNWWSLVADLDKSLSQKRIVNSSK